MKISTNSKELIDLEACSSGYITFIKAHGDNEVKFSQCLESNGSNDVFWLLEAVDDQLSNQQKSDLRLLACGYALNCLDIFEKAYPDDKRPRLAIEAAQAFARNEITAEELEEARKEADAAARAARAAGSANWAASRAAIVAARAAARATWAATLAAAQVARATWVADRATWVADMETRAEARNNNTKMLMDLLLKWESHSKQRSNK